VFILDDEIKNENKEKFNSLAKKYGREIHFIPTGELSRKLMALGIAPYRGSYTTNFKMFINEYIVYRLDII
jgi:lipopolysaccharide biosynthesis glycosyltransferase